MLTGHSTATVLTEKDTFGHWLAGFAAAEGCFQLDGGKKPSCEFIIGLRSDDSEILERIQEYLGVGYIDIRGTNARCPNPAHCLRVRSPIDCHEVVMPFFDAFPLRNKKTNDFTCWRKGITLHRQIGSRIHKIRPDGKRLPLWTEANRLHFSMLARQLKRGREFGWPSRSVCHNASGDEWKHWLAGFIAGDGHLGISLNFGRGSLTPAVGLNITLRADDRDILEAIQKFFGSGRLRNVPRRGTIMPQVSFQIRDVASLHDHVIPFLSQFPLRSKKQTEVESWSQAVRLCQSVQMRPWVSGGSRGPGRHTKWTSAEISEFSRLLEETRSKRKFRD